MRYLVICAGLNASIAFDVSIQQLQMLLYGSSLYIIPSEVRTNPERFVSYIRRINWKCLI